MNENKNTTYNNLQETNKRFIKRNITQYAYSTKIVWSQINNLMKALEKRITRREEIIKTTAKINRIEMKEKHPPIIES